MGSDDGYRTTSEASSSNGPIPTTPTPPPPPNRAGSKIPFFLGSLRGLGNGGGSSKSLTGGNDDYAGGGMSLAAKTPTRADSFGRHSLRMRSLRMTPVSSSPSSTPTGIPMPIYNYNNNNKSTTNSSSGSSNTWNGRRLRQRPSLQPDSFIAPSSSDRGGAQHHHHRSRSITSTSSLWKQQQQQQPLSSLSPSASGGYSSSHYNNYNNGYSRATSTSPSTTRRNYYNSSSSGGGSGGSRSNWSTPAQSPEYRSTAPDWGSVAGASSAVQQPTAPTAITTKMSPLLRDMLDDVEVDNDASILRKMEQIVNQYKARVENLLAKEGKTLHDDDWTVPPPPPALVPTPTAASAASAAVVDTQLTATDRSRNTPAAPAAAPPGSPLPSRIPKPLFVYRPKETCL